MCLCNAECELAGMHACDLSMDKPLCGGVCRPSAPTRALTCSAGDDLVKLEASSTTIEASSTTISASAGAEILPGWRITRLTGDAMAALAIQPLMPSDR